MTNTNDPAAAADRLTQFYALREQGIGVEVAAGMIGVSKRTAWHYNKALKSQQAQADIRARLVTAVPETLEVTSVSESRDETGALRSQHIRMSPEAQPDEVLPEGHVVKGLSTLVDGEGKVRAQWVKTKLDATKIVLSTEAAVRAAIDRMDNHTPIPTVPPPTTTSGELCTLYTMTDCHVGMLAWPDETQGDAWDTDISKRVLVNTFYAMVDAAPPSHFGILNQLGDFLHFDSLLAVTPQSGHVLDSDSRYQLVVEAATSILELMVEKMLTKHQNVQVYMNEGNHDMAGSVWLRVLFARLFRDNPRVHVERSPNPYQCYHFGNTMIGFHHGHLAKWEKLPQVFAAQYAKVWGATEHRYVHTGHYHELHEKEHPGIIVLQHPTIASPDAYAARNGYMSKRQAMAITYSSKHGEIGRSSFLPVE